MAEVAHAAEHHRHAAFVGGVYHFLIAHRAARLHHTGGAGIDHIAISESFASMASSPQVWQRENSRGELMSDHCGVAIEFI